MGNLAKNIVSKSASIILMIFATNVVAIGECNYISGVCWDDAYKAVLAGLGNPSVDKIKRNAGAGSPDYYFLARYMEAMGITKDNHSKYNPPDLNKAVDIEQASIKYKNYLTKEDEFSVINRLAHRAICAEGFKDSVFSQDALRKRGCDTYFTTMGSPLASNLSKMNNTKSLLAVVNTYYQPCRTLDVLMEDVVAFSANIDYADAAMDLFHTNADYIKFALDQGNIGASVYCKIIENRDLFVTSTAIKNRANFLETKSRALIERCANKSSQEKAMDELSNSVLIEYRQRSLGLLKASTNILGNLNVMMEWQLDLPNMIRIGDVVCNGKKLQ